MSYDPQAIRGLFGPTPSGYGTHRPVLAEALLRTKGPILELGAGNHSTVALSQAAMLMERRFESYETDRGWADYGATTWIWSYDRAPIEGELWGLAFVDHGPIQRRIVDLARLAYWADVVVVHDTEDILYGYDQIWPLYEHRLDYTINPPWTSVLSNFIDVSEWVIP